MNLNIDKTNIEKLDLDSLQAKSNDALDMLWNVAWLKNAMNKLDRASVESLQETAGKICSQCEVAVIVATGDTAKMIKACTSAIQQREACADVIVFGDSFSPAEYAEVMTDLEKKRLRAHFCCAGTGNGGYERRIRMSETAFSYKIRLGESD